MPSADQILAGLREITNSWRLLAIAWHVYFALLGTALALGARPAKPVMGVLLALPLVSVSALAWLAANPFNGTFFALAGIGLAVIAAGLPRTRIQLAPPWAIVAGVLLFAFGWAYPHFLDTRSYLLYLYAAPTGLIPCPTLAIVTGLALIAGGLGSRAWSLVLGGTGIFYGLFGAMRLGVELDWVLLLGALIMLGTVFATSRTSPTPSRRVS